MARILLAISRYDYGRPEWGDSFEYMNFFGPLDRMGHVVTVFDTTDPRRSSPEVVTKELLSTVKEFAPDLMLCLLATDELPLDAVREAGQHTITANWFADDAWRFNWFSKRVAPSFHWAITTSRAAEARYRDMGVNSIFLPWGYNQMIFHPGDGQKMYDVSFVGQPHGVRGRTINGLRAEGHSVYARGGGWPGGRAGWSEMAQIFASSKINLNFTESSAGPLLKRGWRFRGTTRADSLLIPYFPPPAQMKARMFEVAGCGSFILTGPFDELGECFTPGREVVVVHDIGELKAAVRYYLEHEEERETIAQAAMVRATTEHSYERRFTALFERLQLTVSH